jgi:hypothetical protein
MHIKGDRNAKPKLIYLFRHFYPKIRSLTCCALLACRGVWDLRKPHYKTWHQLWLLLIKFQINVANPSDSEVRLYDCTPFVCVSVRLINGATGSWHDIVGKCSHEILVTPYRLLYMLPVTWSWLEIMSLFFVVYKEWQIDSRFFFRTHRQTGCNHIVSLWNRSD